MMAPVAREQDLEAIVKGVVLGHLVWLLRFLFFWENCTSE